MQGQKADEEAGQIGAYSVPGPPAHGVFPEAGQVDRGFHNQDDEFRQSHQHEVVGELALGRGHNLVGAEQVQAQLGDHIGQQEDQPGALLPEAEGQQDQPLNLRF